MKQKSFFITFTGLSMKQIRQLFFEGESPALSNLSISNFMCNIGNLKT